MRLTVTTPRAAIPRSSGGIVLLELFAALSRALDLAEGQPKGHAIRTWRIGLRLAEEIGLDPEQKAALSCALVLKDLGTSAVAGRLVALFGADEQAIRREWTATDWSRLSQVFRHAARHAAPAGAAADRALRIFGISARGRAEARQVVAARARQACHVAREIGLSEAAVAAIASAEERWDGRGDPHGLEGEAIPLLARIVAAAQSLEIWRGVYGHEAAYDLLWSRRGRWFDPVLVDALFAFRADNDFWTQVREAEGAAVARWEADSERAVVDESTVDRIAAGFAQVVDAKSSWTRHHSVGVAALADGIAAGLGLSEQERRALLRAALLHDLGKLGVSSLVLDRAGSLTEAHREELRRHPVLTRQLLARAPGFSEVAAIAGAHHERLDGRGYPSRLTARELSMPMRALILAEVAEALVAHRPFRPALPPEKALAIMRRDRGRGLCPDCFDILETFLGGRKEPEVTAGD